MFRNWVDSTDRKESDFAMMIPEEREEYGQYLLGDRPKYVPIKPEQFAKLPPGEKNRNMKTL